MARSRSSRSRASVSRREKRRTVATGCRSRCQRPKASSREVNPSWRALSKTTSRWACRRAAASCWAGHSRNEPQSAASPAPTRIDVWPAKRGNSFRQRRSSARTAVACLRVRHSITVGPLQLADGMLQGEAQGRVRVALQLHLLAELGAVLALEEPGRRLPALLGGLDAAQVTTFAQGGGVFNPPAG